MRAAALASGLAALRQKGHTLRHDFMLAAFLAVFRLPAPLLEAAIDDHAISLAQVLSAMFRLFTKHDDVDKADFFLKFFRLLKASASRQTETGDRCPARRITQLGVAGQIPDQNNFVKPRQRSLPAVPAQVRLSVEQALAPT